MRPLEGAAAQQTVHFQDNWVQVNGYEIIQSSLTKQNELGTSTVVMLARYNEGELALSSVVSRLCNLFCQGCTYHTTIPNLYYIRLT